MKYKTILSTITLNVALLFAFELFGQAPPTKIEINRMDSIQTVYEKDKVQTQKAEEVEKMTEVKNEQSAAKAKAKEAQRVEDEADDAAKQSSDALKAEKKAQKSRQKADKQAEKAEKARDKSDLN
jgi:hypothetical protein